MYIGLRRTRQPRRRRRLYSSHVSLFGTFRLALSAQNVAYNVVALLCMALPLGAALVNRIGSLS